MDTITNNELKWGITYHQLGWLENSVKKYVRNEKRVLNFGESLLHIAARDFNGEEMCDTLIQSGYNVNARDDFGHTPLFAAINVGNTYIAQLLLDNKANVNHQSKDLDTPLIKAVVDNDYDMVKLLIENGAKVNMANKFDETPLKIACQENRMKIARLLIDNGGLIEN